MAESVLERVYPWIKSRVSENPQVFALSGAQGIGKSTLCENLVERFQSEGIKAISLSIDDFYLTRNEQIELAKENPESPYLQSRGYPGTHDLKLLNSTLHQLKTPEQNRVQVPRYDKSAFQGKGDRFSKTADHQIETPIQIILLEGWFLGFRVPEKIQMDMNSTQNAELEVLFKKIDTYLRDYESSWQSIDHWILLEPVVIENVVSWRIEAEEKMKLKRGQGMSTEETRRYIELFLPAYRRYLPVFVNRMKVLPNHLHLRIGKEREIL